HSGFTNSNYTQLTELYSKYKDKGFEILAFPCNQFLYQEPGTSEDAEQFACTRFKAEYPIFQKVTRFHLVAFALSLWFKCFGKVLIDDHGQM
ncbi:probable glutathione peroxidase 5, partial [Salvia hispanica]|uniref:probable glutathione peroxidase 5 n=1 Tax=Salvia hispanica TaxID=49212 RepID=UPI002009A9A8